MSEKKHSRRYHGYNEEMSALPELTRQKKKFSTISKKASGSEWHEGMA
jgi:hypothetical protein